MTNESISGFLNSIAEAKRAFDAEPEYQRRIHELEERVTSLGQTVADREIRIHNLKQFEIELTSKLRSVEAERDDAGFRHLEADDKVQGLLKVVHQYVGDGLKIIGAVTGIEQTMIAQSVLNATNEEITYVRDLAEERYDCIVQLEREMSLAQEQLTRPFAPSEDTSSSNVEGTDPWSPRPEPYDYELPRSVPELQQGQREAVPTASGSAPIPQDLAAIPVGDNVDAAVKEQLAKEGQSDGPFASRMDTPFVLKETQSQTVSSTSAESETFAASNASPPERNRDRSTFFRGRKYYDVTYYVPLHQWLAEGGTEADYNWRPLPDVSRASHQS